MAREAGFEPELFGFVYRRVAIYTTPTFGGTGGTCTRINQGMNLGFYS
jgi:hypothetical protein